MIPACPAVKFHGEHRNVCLRSPQQSSRKDCGTSLLSQQGTFAMTVAGAVHRITSGSSFEAILLDRHAAKQSSISASNYAACVLFMGISCTVQRVYRPHWTALPRFLARRARRRDAGASQRGAQRRPGASEGRPQGRLSRPLGALAALDDAGIVFATAACRGDGTSDPMGSIIPLDSTSDRDGRGKFSTMASQLRKASEISSGATPFRALPN